MHFETGNIYHIYNQGNNRQRIFFERENYLFFLRKMRKHLLPYCDLVAYCLMPNHFHWMVRVNEVEVVVPAEQFALTRSATQSRTLGGGDPTHQMTPIHRSGSTRSATQSRTPSKQVSLQKSIGILLASYTRAINKQRDRSGSLFRTKTKAQCLTEPDGLSPAFYKAESSTQLPTERSDVGYLQNCFDYIHQNPIRAGLVSDLKDWEFSSYPDYVGDRRGTLVNREVAELCGIDVVYGVANPFPE